MGGQICLEEHKALPVDKSINVKSSSKSAASVTISRVEWKKEQINSMQLQLQHIYISQGMFQILINNKINESLRLSLSLPRQRLSTRKVLKRSKATYKQNNEEVFTT